MVQPIPEGFGTVSIYLSVKDAIAAMEFYAKAFGADDVVRLMGPGGAGVMYAEMRIGDTMIMLSDEFPDFPGPRSPKSLGGTTATVHIYCDDVDAAFERAVAAGAEPAMPPMDAFWGDRFGKVVDPEGHHWSIATHTEDVPHDQLQDRMLEWMKNNCPE